MTAALRTAAAVAVLLVGLALVAGELASRYDTELGTDDANIYLRYARNLSRGEGFVWNRGGETVEGISSPLWLAFVTAVAAASLPIEAMLRALALLLATLAVAAPAVAAARFGRDGPERLAHATIVGLWCLSAPNFVGWTVLSLGDTALYTATFTAAVVALVARVEGRGGSSLPIALALLVWTRPEGAIAGSALLVLGFWLELGTGGPIQATRRSLFPASAWGASCAALAIWRWTLFGDLLPNTYYAKVSPDLGHRLGEGLADLRRLVASAGLAVAATMAIALVVCVRSALRVLRGEPAEGGHSGGLARAREGVAGAALIGLGIPLVEGGDFFGGGRFFQPVWPTLGLLASLTVVPAWRRSPSIRSVWRGGLLTAVAVLAAIQVVQLQRSGLEFGDQFPIPVGGRKLGEALTAATERARRPVVGACAVGGLGVAYDGPIFDLLGLNDREMGHSPGDRKGERAHAAFHVETFWRRPPEIVMPTLGSAPEIEVYERRAVEPGSFKDVTLRGLLRSERFRAAYEPYEASVSCLRSSRDDQGEILLFAWVRRDWPLSPRFAACRRAHQR